MIIKIIKKLQKEVLIDTYQQISLIMCDGISESLVFLALAMTIKVSKLKELKIKVKDETLVPQK
jgi:hypothetical protein